MKLQKQLFPTSTYDYNASLHALKSSVKHFQEHCYRNRNIHKYCTYLCREFSPPLFFCSAIDNNNRLGYYVIATTASHFNIRSTNVRIAVCKYGRTKISFPRTKISRNFSFSQMYCSCTLYWSIKLSLLIVAH